jgi:dTDP-4-amino-4,6-dideoxygalactose transaminase
VGTSSCTSALAATLRSLCLEPGDEVIVPSLTAMPTAEAVTLAGGRVVFADVDAATSQLDPASVAERITDRTRAVIAVHLYGMAAPIGVLDDLTRSRGLVLIEDIAQSFGASLNGAPLGTTGLAGCISFFPSKPLGGFGDGGMVATDDAATARYVRMYTNHGRESKFTHDFEGANERLDGLQAAVLNVRLGVFDEWNARRREVAGWYQEGLAGVSELQLPQPLEGCEPVWHIYPVSVARRDDLRAALRERGIQTGVHYPLPLHLQPAYEHLGLGRGTLPVAERLTAETVSLPMDPLLTREQVDWVVESIKHHLAPAPVRAGE